MTALPSATTVEEYRLIRRDEAALRPGVAAICARHGMEAAAAVRFADGSLPVYGVGAAHVLKLYPPCDRRAYEVERLVLATIERRLPIPTPALIADGELDDWSYLVMTRLEGRSLAEAWPEIAPPERARLIGQLGAGLAALHALEANAFPSLHHDWNFFLETQRAGCVARQRASGLASSWLDQLPDFLAGLALESPPRPALLHTEVMREHLLVSKGAEGWALSGLFDFEPAMIGAAEYELASIGVFVTGGDGELLRCLLEAYGYRSGDLDESLQQRCLAYAALHRYSNLAWYLLRVPPPPEVTTLAALAAHWWRL